MSDFKIKCFSEYVLRTPLFPLSAYHKVIENYTSEKAAAFYKNPIVREAIHLASPELQKQLDKWAFDSSSLSSEKRSSGTNFFKIRSKNVFSLYAIWFIRRMLCGKTRF